jgi:hypothetical protein
VGLALTIVDRACVKQHRTHKGGFELFASVSHHLLTTETELLVGTEGKPESVPGVSTFSVIPQLQEHFDCGGTIARAVVVGESEDLNLSLVNLPQNINPLQ